MATVLDVVQATHLHQVKLAGDVGQLLILLRDVCLSLLQPAWQRSHARLPRPQPMHGHCVCRGVLCAL